MKTLLTLSTSCKASLKHVTDLSLPSGKAVALRQILAPLQGDVPHRLAQTLAGMDPWSKYGFSSATLARFVFPADNSNPRYLICAGDEIAGLAVIKNAWLFGSYLNILAVLPDHQKHGVGSAFLHWFETKARTNGDRNQFVVTSAFNTGALALYKRHGFEPIANLDGLISDTETEILLRKRLKQV